MIESVRQFGALREEFVEITLRHNPVAATMVGIHDYDALQAMPGQPQGSPERR